MSRDRTLLHELSEIVGNRHCLADPSLTARFTTDFTGRFGGEAAAVVRPADRAEVAAVLAASRRHHAAVIPQGGNTGLVGGAVPRGSRRLADDCRPEVVLVTTRMNELDIDPTNRLLEAGGGATLAVAEERAAGAGLHLGIDLAARDSATLGGMTSTDAGGVHVVRYGPMSARLAGLEAVLVDGTVVDSGAKECAGWDTSSLFAGAEGTLGVITKVRLRLEPLPTHRVVALVALHDLAAAISLAGDLARRDCIEAVELTSRDGMMLVTDTFALAPPVGLGSGAQAWLTVEAAGWSDPLEEMSHAFADERVIEAAVGTSTSERERLWAYRERHADAVSRLGVAHKLDVALPADRLEEFLVSLPELVRATAGTAHLVVWGHIAVGNMHVNIIGPDPSDEAVDDTVLSWVCELGGSVAAEHGIGVAKARWLGRASTAGALEVMARVKDVLDPERVLNPGVLDPTRAG